MQLVIVAGGKGTRLQTLSKGLPKPLIDVGGIPLIDHHIRWARRNNISDLLILTGFGAEHIEKYVGDGSRWSARVTCHVESSPLGTAGSVLASFPLLQEQFFVVYGDVMLNVDLTRMAQKHRPGSATIFLHPNDHPFDSDLVTTAGDGRIIAFHPYPHRSGVYYPNLVNAGLYLVSKKSLEPYAQSQSDFCYPLDFGKHLFPKMIQDGIELQGYVSREYIKDAGTPTRVESVRADWNSTRIQRGSLHTPMAAVFLDRDGTLNHDPGWLSSPGQLRLLPGVADAVRTINKSGRLAVVISNQPVVARGGCSESDLQLIHNKLQWLLGEEHAYLDALYYCPHHPHKGFAGEKPELKIDCKCRKPGTELFEQAARDLNIDLGQSWMIGDSASDIAAAAALGIQSILVRSNQSVLNPSAGHSPTFVCDTTLQAVEIIALESTVNNDHHANTAAD